MIHQHQHLRQPRVFVEPTQEVAQVSHKCPLATHHLPDGDLISATSGSFDGHLAFITAPGEEDLWWIQRLGFWFFHHCRLLV